MNELDKRFAAAVERVRNAPEQGSFKPSNDFKLKMYAFYRQASDGDVSGKRPGMLDPVGRFKYDAWAQLRGMARDDAKRRYVAEVDGIARVHG